MHSLASPPWVVSLPAATARLAGIEMGQFDTTSSRQPQIALPLGYDKDRRRRYPLLVMLRAADVFGSAVEMTRLLAGSREVRPCIVANVADHDATDADALAAVIAHCRRRYRIDDGEVAVFGDVGAAPAVLRAFSAGIAGATRCIVATEAVTADKLSVLSGDLASAVAWTALSLPAAAPKDVHWKALPEATATTLAVPALVHGVRRFWARDHRYGDEVMALSNPLVTRVITRLAPLLRPLTRRPRFAPEKANPHVVRAQALGRDFEIFLALPPGAGLARKRRYPALIALDANGGFATVAETAARLARAGAIEGTIVIGIGTPRAQGDLEFAFRRFEELSPPPDTDYRYDDALGRFFLSLFALRGEDARVQLGKAPQFYEFIARELLPQLCARLPIAPDAVTLLGHSAAGTFVGYALAQPDAPFTGCICLSPGVAISGQWMLRNARAPKGARVFTALGGEELGNRFNGIAGIPRTPDYVAAVRAGGATATPCEVLEGESHTSVYPRAVAQGMRALLRQRSQAEISVPNARRGS